MHDSDDTPRTTVGAMSRRRLLAAAAAGSASMGALGYTHHRRATEMALAVEDSNWTADDAATAADGVSEVIIGDGGNLTLSWTGLDDSETQYDVRFTLEARLATAGENAGSDQYEVVAESGCGHKGAIDIATDGLDGQKDFLFFRGGDVTAGDHNEFTICEGGRKHGVDIVGQHSSMVASDFTSPDGTETATNIDIRLTVSLHRGSDGSMAVDAVSEKTFSVVTARSEGDVTSMEGNAGTGVTDAQ